MHPLPTPPPSLPSGCYMLLPLGSYEAPASLTCLTRPHGLTAGRALGSSGVDLARACSRLARSVRAAVRPSAYPASTLSLLSVEVRPVARRRRFDSRRQQGVRRAVALVLGRVGAHGAGEQLELHAQHLLARLVVHRRRVARREDLPQGAHVSKAVMVEPW